MFKGMILAAGIVSSLNGSGVLAQGALSADAIAALPGLDSPQLAVAYGFVKFNYVSCAAMEFEAEVVSEGKIDFVSIKLLSTLDCIGPKSSKSYDVQISSGYTGRRVVVLNPLAVARPGLRI